GGLVSGDWAPWPGPAGDDPLQAYLREVEGVAPLGDAERDALVERAAGGEEEAGHRLVEAHLALVVELVRGHRHTGVEPVGLVRAGNVGLARAVALLPGQTLGCGVADAVA